MLAPVAALLVSGTLSAVTPVTVEPTPSGPHFVIEGEPYGAAKDLLPLKATRADVRISGVIAHVTVRQVWENHAETPLSANYVFPASTRAAVFGMRMRIGDRVLRAKIKEREAARKVYEAAKNQGRTASLLEQERANVFSMHVANILPGDRIEVELDYTELLVPRDKEYEFVYPQVVGPRYAKSARASQRWMSNPFLAHGDKAPWSFGVDVKLAAGVPVRDIHSPSHPIEPRFTSTDDVDVSISGDEEDIGGAKDFVMRWRVVGEAVQTGVMLYRDKERGENFFLLLAQPPERVSDEQMPPRELVFIVDVSGSMNGFPTETSRKLMKRLLNTLRPQDTFNVLLFAGRSALLSEKSLPATAANLELAVGRLEMAGAGGGTNLDGALGRALSLPTSDDTSRSFVLLTDGYVGFENSVFDLVRDNIGRANIYAFGIGSSVNRLLIEGIAKAGLGEPFVVLGPETADREVARFEKAVSRPALTNVRVHYEGFDAFDTEPSVPADLLEDRPLVIYGKYRGPSAGHIRIQGSAGDRPFERIIPVEDNLERPAHETLRHLWARGRIAHLADVGTPSEEDIKEVTRLGLKYRLLTHWTSFVAVDYEVRNPNGATHEVAQPAPLPAGVSGRSAGEGIFSSQTTIDFADDTIEGGLVVPDGMYMESRKKMQVRSLIPIRQSFVHKIDTGGLGSIGGLSTMGSGRGGGGRGSGSASYGSAGLGLRGVSGSGSVSRDVIMSTSSPKTRVRGGEPVITGSLDRQVIRRVLRGHQQRVQGCYRRQLTRTPGISGKLLVEIKVAASGKVSGVRILTDSVKSPPLAKCVATKLTELRFPKPPGGGGVVIRYPFVFRTGS